MQPKVRNTLFDFWTIQLKDLNLNCITCFTELMHLFSIAS